MPIKRKKDNILVVAILLMTLVFAGCRSTKRESASHVTDELLPLIQQMQALSPVEGSLSGKLSLEAAIGEKSISVGGSLGVEKGAGLHLAATALGLFEVARLEAATVDFCLINKVGKEYARVDYSPSSLLGQIGLRYNTLQAVFLNEPFMPDGSDFYSSLSKMTLLRDGNSIIAVTPEYKNMRFTFSFDISSGELSRTEGVYNNKVKVTCCYSDFDKLGNRTFPTRINLEISGVGEPVKLCFYLSNLKEGRYTFKKSNLSSYKKMDIADIIKALD